MTGQELHLMLGNLRGRKELVGRIEISNPCVRLIANMIICYNPVILSRLLEK